MPNLHRNTVSGFGKEWQTFDQTRLAVSELDDLGARYFALFPWERLPASPEGFDMGCGSGRWAKFVVQHVGQLHLIDASEDALDVARRNLSDHGDKCHFHLASLGEVPLPQASMDFGFSLGVLHHVPDPERGLRSCAELLKPGAPLLVYMYYAFDNKPTWYRALWRTSDMARRLLSRCPHQVKVAWATVVAGCVYWPVARLSLVLERAGLDVENLPLSFYRCRSVYTMRTDAYDRFGTRLEHRFTADQMREMMKRAGLGDIRFSSQPPYWCAVGHRIPAPERR